MENEWIMIKKNMANDYKDKNIDIQKLVGHGLKIYIYMQKERMTAYGFLKYMENEQGQRVNNMSKIYIYIQNDQEMIKNKSKDSMRKKQKEIISTRFKEEGKGGGKKRLMN